MSATVGTVVGVCFLVATSQASSVEELPSWQPRTPVTTTTPAVATTTTTTLPSAVTTVPQGCALAPQALAVFVGEVVSTDPVSAVFLIQQIRAGSLEGYQDGGNVEVRYGSDVKYLDVGTSYIVGVAPDPISSRLSSRVKQSSEIFGGAEIAGSNTRCPVFEDPVRTLTLDGRAISAGIFTQFFDEPWRLAIAFIAPPLLVLIALFGVVWFRRGVGR
jgi:hypothetical protein